MKSINILSVLLCVGFFTLSVINQTVGQGTRQNAVIFERVGNSSNSTCSGTIRYNNSTNIEFSTNRNSSYSVKVYGLWRFGISSNSSNSSQIRYQDNITLCSFPTITNASRISLARLGNEYMDRPVLYLYPQSQLGGTPVLITGNSSSVRLTIIQSYILHGRHSWTIFSGNNYNGTSTCLTYSAAVGKNGFGISYSVSSNIPVRSVRYGCPGGAGGGAGGSSGTRLTVGSTILNYGVAFLIIGKFLWL